MRDWPGPKHGEFHGLVPLAGAVELGANYWTSKIAWGVHQAKVGVDRVMRDRGSSEMRAGSPSSIDDIEILGEINCQS